MTAWLADHWELLTVAGALSVGWLWHGLRCHVLHIERGLPREVCSECRAPVGHAHRETCLLVEWARMRGKRTYVAAAPVKAGQAVVYGGAFNQRQVDEFVAACAGVDAPACGGAAAGVEHSGCRKGEPCGWVDAPDPRNGEKCWTCGVPFSIHYPFTAFACGDKYGENRGYEAGRAMDKAAHPPLMAYTVTDLTSGKVTVTTNTSAPPAPAFKVGAWVRLKCGGALAKVGHVRPCSRCEDGTLEVDLWLDGGAKLDVCDHSIEPAVPRGVEQWKYIACERHGRTVDLEPQARWGDIENSPVLKHIEDQTRCGCLVPVNFGRGA